VNKKATWAWADALYWFFYIPLTLVVIVALIVVPTSILNSSVQPTNLDATIMQKRILNSLTPTSPTLGYQESQPYFDPKQAIMYSTSQKDFGVKIEAGETLYINRQYYEDARPLAGVGYKNYQGLFYVKGVSYPTIYIDQIYAPRYDQ
jgi:hypothetical protein